jgi:hypothetical protein
VRKFVEIEHRQTSKHNQEQGQSDPSPGGGQTQTVGKKQATLHDNTQSITRLGDFSNRFYWHFWSIHPSGRTDGVEAIESGAGSLPRLNYFMRHDAPKDHGPKEAGQPSAQIWASAQRIRGSFFRFWCGRAFRRLWRRDERSKSGGASRVGPPLDGQANERGCVARLFPQLK